jgi:hypothetical protein
MDAVNHTDLTCAGTARFSKARELWFKIIKTHASAEPGIGDTMRTTTTSNMQTL